jgi:hypothetical protein
MDDNHVLVSGVHGRHFEVHKQIQAAFPDDFPLVVSLSKSASAASINRPDATKED